MHLYGSNRANVPRSRTQRVILFSLSFELYGFTETIIGMIFRVRGIYLFRYTLKLTAFDAILQE